VAVALCRPGACVGRSRHRAGSGQALYPYLRTCGREYEGVSCPHCDEIRRRLRGDRLAQTESVSGGESHVSTQTCLATTAALPVRRRRVRWLPGCILPVVGIALILVIIAVVVF